MKRIIDTSEVLGTVEVPEGTREVCVSAVANYDEDTRQLVMKLNAYLRNTDLATKARFSAAWLPKPQTVRESVGADEAMAMARDIFHRWVPKVREAVPSLHRV